MDQRDHIAALTRATAYLSNTDPILQPVIARIGVPTFAPNTDYYWKLVDAIISQQLSVKAATTIEKRFLDLFGGTLPRPHQILTKTPEELRSVGLSGAKARYVLDLALHIEDGELQIDKLPSLSNAEVITELTAVKGVGEWTAHMFLIFALGRLDVLPVGDLGIRNGVQTLYNLAAMPTPSDVQDIANTFYTV